MGWFGLMGWFWSCDVVLSPVGIACLLKAFSYRGLLSEAEGHTPRLPCLDPDLASDACHLFARRRTADDRPQNGNSLDGACCVFPPLLAHRLAYPRDQHREEPSQGRKGCLFIWQSRGPFRAARHHLFPLAECVLTPWDAPPSLRLFRFPSSAPPPPVGQPYLP